MTNKLISLAILIFFLLTGHSFSDEKFLFPKEKPSIFKKIDKNVVKKNLEGLPQKKPIIKENESSKKDVLTDKKIIEKKEFKEKKNS